MNYTVDISDSAEKEILDAVRYIANELKSPAAANALLDQLDKTEQRLSENPYMYPPVPHEYLAKKGIRFVSVKKYLLFYNVNEENHAVNVSAFLFGGRDWQTILGKGDGK